MAVRTLRCASVKSWRWGRLSWVLRVGSICSRGSLKAESDSGEEEEQERLLALKVGEGNHQLGSVGGSASWKRPEKSPFP